jgi:hypothetical protein
LLLGIGFTTYFSIKKVKNNPPLWLNAYNKHLIIKYFAI